MWSLDEDELLRYLVKTCVNAAGQPMWSEVARRFGTRGRQECRCRWKRLQDGEKLRQLGCWKNRCKECGLPRRGHSCLKKQYSITHTAPTETTEMDEDRKIRLQSFSTFENVYGDVEFRFLI